ncbi:MAG: hypothetical protein KDI27_09665 [Gammaproteobacteria bacterium]|nr:hypothetical protein [Gammaproteobacteria bacterium]
MKRSYRIFSAQCSDLRWLIYLWILVLSGVVALLVTVYGSAGKAEAYGFLVPAAGAFIAVIVKLIQDLFLRANRRMGAYDVIIADIGAICLTLSSFKLDDVKEESRDRIDPALFRWKLDKLRRRGEDYFTVFNMQIPEITGLRQETLSHITQFYTLLKGSRDAALGAASWRATIPLNLAYCDLYRVFYLVVRSLEQARPVLSEAGQHGKVEMIEETLDTYNRVLELFRLKCQPPGSGSD